MGNKMTRRCASVVDERYTRPQGLYPQRDVDQKKLRRLILDSKLAPCFPGEDEPSADVEECPICFLCYPSLNRSKCCSKGVCTECYLQMKTPRPARAAQCPFCKSHNYTVEFRGVKSQEEKSIEAAEEQKVIEAKIRIRKQELLDDEQREQRQMESNTNNTDTNPSQEALDTSAAQDVPVEELGRSGPAVELPESRASCAQIVETPSLQESEATTDSSSSCDGLEASSRAHEQPASEETLISSAAAALPLVCQPLESATSQHQLRPALPGFSRHRDEEFDFDLEDIMVMEAIWQSIQEQGTCHSYVRAEAIQLQAPSTHLANPAAGGSTTASDSHNPSAPTAASQPEQEHHAQQQQQQQQPRGPGGRMTGGLATAIAALAERHAMKAEPAEPSPPPPPSPPAAGAGESLRIRANQQNEGGTSTSSCAEPNTTSTTASAGEREVMLPQTFEEQMMLAMALSITDAQSRARLEDGTHNPRASLA